MRAEGMAIAESELEAFEALSSRSSELDQVLANAPDDLAAHQVYADWLLERGDPRGELISLALASSPTENWLATNLGQVIGPLAHHRTRLKIRWKSGWIEAIEIGSQFATSDEEIVQLLCALPASLLLRRLTMPARFAPAIAACTFPPKLDEIELLETWQPIVLDPIAKRVRRLAVNGYAVEIALDSDRLEELGVLSYDLSTVLHGVMTSHLPKLRRLELQRYLPQDGPHEDNQIWETFCEAIHPSLREVRLTDVLFNLRAFLSSRLARNLERIELVGHTVEMEHVPMFLDDRSYASMPIEMRSVGINPDARRKLIAAGYTVEV